MRTPSIALPAITKQMYIVTSAYENNLVPRLPQCRESLVIVRCCYNTVSCQSNKEHQGVPLLFLITLSAHGFCYARYTTHDTIGFMSLPKAKGYKCHDWDSNPHSA